MQNFSVSLFPTSLMSISNNAFTMSDTFEEAFQALPTLSLSCYQFVFSLFYDVNNVVYAFITSDRKSVSELGCHVVVLNINLSSNYGLHYVKLSISRNNWGRLHCIQHPITVSSVFEISIVHTSKGRLLLLIWKRTISSMIGIMDSDTAIQRVIRWHRLPNTIRHWSLARKYNKCLVYLLFSCILRAVFQEWGSSMWLRTVRQCSGVFLIVSEMVCIELLGCTSTRLVRLLLIHWSTQNSVTK